MYLAAGSFQQVRLFEIAGSNANVGPVSTMTGHKSNVIAVGFFPDGRLLFTGSEDGVVRIWDTRSASCLREYDAGEVLTAVVVHPNNVRFLLNTYANAYPLARLDHSHSKRLRENFVLQLGSKCCHSRMLTASRSLCY